MAGTESTNNQSRDSDELPRSSPYCIFPKPSKSTRDEGFPAEYESMRTKLSLSPRRHIEHFIRDVSIHRDLFSDINWQSQQTATELEFCYWIYGLDKQESSFLRLLQGGAVAVSQNSSQVNSIVPWHEPEFRDTKNQQSDFQDRWSLVIAQNLHRHGQNLANIMIQVWSQALESLLQHASLFDDLTLLKCKDTINGNIIHLKLSAKHSSLSRELRMALQAVVIQLSGNFGNQGREAQVDFRKLLEDRYFPRDETHPKYCPKIECAITHHQHAKYIGAHIVDCAIGNKIFQHYFGAQVSLKDATNGLILCNLVEKSFDRGKLIVLPTRSSEGDSVLRSVILDPERASRVMFQARSMTRPEDDWEQHTWAEIDGRELKFSVRSRPHSVYLYFHTLRMIARKLIDQPLGWTYRLQEVMSRDYNGERIFVPCSPEVANGPLGQLSEFITGQSVLVAVEDAAERDRLQTGSPCSASDKKNVTRSSDDVIADHAKLRDAFGDLLGNFEEPEEEDSALVVDANTDCSSVE